MSAEVFIELNRGFDPLPEREIPERGLHGGAELIHSASMVEDLLEGDNLASSDRPDWERLNLQRTGRRPLSVNAVKVAFTAFTFDVPLGSKEGDIDSRSGSMEVYAGLYLSSRMQIIAELRLTPKGIKRFYGLCLVQVVDKNEYQFFGGVQSRILPAIALKALTNCWPGARKMLSCNFLSQSLGLTS